jgi:hypothetical protein
MSAQRLSKEDFQMFLRALFDNYGPKVKYQNPTAWRGYGINKQNLHANTI